MHQCPATSEAAVEAACGVVPCLARSGVATRCACRLGAGLQWIKDLLGVGLKHPPAWHLFIMASCRGSSCFFRQLSSLVQACCGLARGEGVSIPLVFAGAAFHLCKR